MKILLLTSSLDCGGVESHILTLAVYLCRDGHDVIVASSGGRTVKKLEKKGIKHFFIPLKGKNVFNIFSAQKILMRLIRDEAIDIVHAHSRPACFIADIACKKLKIPFAATVHAKFSTPWIYRKLSRWGNITIAVSEDLRYYVCESYGISSENTRVVTNGVDTEEFFISNETLSNSPVIVFSSRLDKDCSDVAFMLCSLYGKIKESFPKARIYICGGGDAYSELSSASCDKPDIRLLGNVENMGEVLRKASVFVGVSRAAMEAMACGVPVILGGNEGFLGLLKEERELDYAALENFCCRGEGKLDEGKLFSAISDCLSMSEAQRSYIGKRMSRYIIDNHSAEEMAKKTVNIYKEIYDPVKKRNGGVLLCGYYGFGNMGDNALLRASIRLCRKIYPDKAITVLSKDPEKDTKEFNVRCIDRMSPIEIFKAFSHSDTLIFGGGTLLQDRTSLRSLIYYTSIIKFAEGRGLSIELWGNGISRPRGRLGAMLIKKALQRCSYIGMRDQVSLAEAEALMENEKVRPIFFNGDLALMQKSSPISRIEYLKRLYRLDCDVNKGYAVAVVKGSAENGYINIFKDKLRELVSDGVKILFIPMFPKEDMKETERICLDIGGVIAENIGESDMVGLIRDSIVVCGMRLHSLVFAASADIPFVGFGGDSKIESFCRENGGLYFIDLY